MVTRNSVYDKSYGDVHATVSCLAQEGLFSKGLDAIIRKPGNAARAIAALNREFKLNEVNKFFVDITTQLWRFEGMLPELRELGFTLMDKSDEEILRELQETAPDWPKGKRCFRFIQIREGEGDAGVQKTFDLHEQMMQQTFAPKWWRWDQIKTDKNHLRLLAGNSTHKSCFGWVCADMDAHRQRDSITAVRSDDSLSDELLAFCWQFPGYCKAIDYEDSPGLFAGGYELSVEGYEDWGGVPLVYRRLHTGKVQLNAYNRSNDYFNDSAPSLLRE